jgi:hypothetical protein
MSFEEIELSMGLKAYGQPDDDGSLVIAINDDLGREVGAAVLVLEGLSGHFSDIWIIPHLRRKGVATSLYDAVERMGIVLRPSDELDEDGALFWESRLSRAVRSSDGDGLRR